MTDSEQAARADVDPAGPEVALSFEAYGARLAPPRLKRIIGVAERDLSSGRTTLSTKCTHLNTFRAGGLDELIRLVEEEAAPDLPDWNSAPLNVKVEKDGRSVTIVICQKATEVMVCSTNRSDGTWVMGCEARLRKELRKACPRLPLVRIRAWIQVLSIFALVASVLLILALLGVFLHSLAWLPATCAAAAFAVAVGSWSGRRARTLLLLSQMPSRKPSWWHLSLAETIMILLTVVGIVISFAIRR